MIGISVGGMTVWQAALRQRERVTGFVLLATAPGLPQGRLAGALRLWPGAQVDRAAKNLGHEVPMLEKDPLRPQAPCRGRGAPAATGDHP